MFAEDEMIEFLTLALTLLPKAQTMPVIRRELWPVSRSLAITKGILSEDGKQLVTTYPGRAIRIFDVKRGGHGMQYNWVIFRSKDGRDFRLAHSKQTIDLKKWDYDMSQDWWYGIHLLMFDGRFLLGTASPRYGITGFLGKVDLRQTDAVGNGPAWSGNGIEYVVGPLAPSAAKDRRLTILTRRKGKSELIHLTSNAESKSIPRLFPHVNAANQNLMSPGVINAVIGRTLLPKKQNGERFEAILATGKTILLRTPAPGGHSFYRGKALIWKSPTKQYSWVSPDRESYNSFGRFEFVNAPGSESWWLMRDKKTKKYYRIWPDYSKMVPK